MFQLVWLKKAEDRNGTSVCKPSCTHTSPGGTRSRTYTAFVPKFHTLEPLSSTKQNTARPDHAQLTALARPTKETKLGHVAQPRVEPKSFMPVYTESTMVPPVPIPSRYLPTSFKLVYICTGVGPGWGTTPWLPLSTLGLQATSTRMQLLWGPVSVKQWRNITPPSKHCHC